MPFQITEEDIENNCGLDEEDLGRWAYIVTGCFMFFDTEEACRNSYREVFHA